jgi:hypothetical protein
MVATRYFLTTTSAYGREEKRRAFDQGQLNGDPFSPIVTPLDYMGWYICNEKPWLARHR